MLSLKLSLGLLFLLCSSSLVVAQSDSNPEPYRPAPSKRYGGSPAVPHPAPSKRYADFASDPAAAAAPYPSKRYINDGPHAPVPSKRYDGNRKRDVSEQEIITSPSAAIDLSPLLCPASMNACPVASTSLPAANTMPTTLAEWADIDVECVDFTVDLHSCGGCSAVDAMHDCSSISGASGVSCIVGQCYVSSCRSGYTLTADNKACIQND
ncbi:hypothetical protein SERLA73DRAFT_178714 [Serpula lacrymans var. lacrymans S7.3]|uniref:Protein CPL1-like domain-containing protein n=2 Tax=Serpula lacrymans var. lacrymans TaxID=341189 RepID=F8PSM1_SERL3|nr:uncharacterized protein SERLADRAFT_347454 [Serpula lacrymans var. lacrymans S7.9]EGO00780.1 hypothetical protein SERLA73DRAFT_178714 [Serpula lacrymans var. lacrymans S7.3]EGO26343.1 hypothetical protein SERLADRAFT_347454 [Serpula lacrymans var. lacrymans S7.9]